MHWVIKVAGLLATVSAALAAKERRAVARARAWAFMAAMHRAQRARTYPTPQERQEEEGWAQSHHLVPGRRPTIAAPDAFTATVMARVAMQPMPVAMIAVRREDTSPIAALRVAGLTLGFSALLALVSGCVLTLVAPAAALAALGVVVSGAVAFLDLALRLPRLAGGLVTNDGLILGLAVIPATVLLMRSLRSRLASSSAREA